MNGFQNLGVYQGNGGAGFQGISDIDLVTIGARRWLYTTSGTGGTTVASALDLGADGPGLSPVDEVSNGAIQLTGLTGSVFGVEIAGRLGVFSLGTSLTTVNGRLLRTDGSFANKVALPALSQTTATVTPFVADGRSLLLTTERASPRIGVYALDSAGIASPLGAANMAGVTAPYADDLSLAALATAHGNFVLAASISTDSVALMRLGADGSLVETGRIGAATGIGLSRPGLVRAISAYGQDFAIVAASQSSTLTVARIGADGSLIAVDHIIDSAASRFGRVAAMEVVEAAGRVVVLAGGNDGGVSAFALLPNGRLMQIAVQGDDATLSLASVTAIETVVDDGALHLFAAGGAEPGISRLTLDLGAWAAPRLGSEAADVISAGAGDDLIDGGGGNDTLAGGDGADIILDGKGQDVMTGGAGADVFVLSADRQLDRITDFEPGLDRIDLSAWGRLYDLSAVSITRSPGMPVALQYGAERLFIEGRDGTPVTDEALRAALVTDVFHMPTTPVSNIFDGLVIHARPDPSGTMGIGTLSEEHGDAALEGTVLRDRLTGNSGGNDISGFEGNDTLDGGAGADTLRGGPGNDSYIVDNIGDLVIEEEGYDMVMSSVDFTLPAGCEALVLTGTAGLTGRGGAGDDRITGNRGDNTIIGGDGHDRLDGGLGADILIGGAGDGSGWRVGLRQAALDVRPAMGQGLLSIAGMATANVAHGATTEWGAAITGTVVTGVSGLTGSFDRVELGPSMTSAPPTDQAPLAAMLAFEAICAADTDCFDWAWTSSKPEGDRAAYDVDLSPIALPAAGMTGVDLPAEIVAVPAILHDAADEHVVSATVVWTETPGTPQAADGFEFHPVADPTAPILLADQPDTAPDEAEANAATWPVDTVEPTVAARSDAPIWGQDTSPSFGLPSLNVDQAQHWEAYGMG